MTEALILAGWLACGVVSCGHVFARFQRNYWPIRRQQFKNDQWFAAMSLIFGPFALAVTLLMGYPRHGWLWPWSAKARAEAGVDA